MLFFFTLSMTINSGLASVVDGNATGYVESVMLRADGVIDVKLDANARFSLPANCTGKMFFDYQEGTASEIYYSLLLGARSTKHEVRLDYQNLGIIGCMLKGVHF